MKRVFREQGNAALAYQFEGLDWKIEEDAFIRERSVRFGNSPWPCMADRDCGPLS
jgi:hypothetical protein